ncbi:hypothetical protein K435DRAFT_804122 [Dendrothele bispora CBS 962.96]|uniref:Uncharacterized protein n=1 Tax=Dendrothele bispora (strain CBS 962.96) TaxID=1314807 RepID=A0A4S8LF84_DENBC|nr:hypothetical protein K435DRAFT_804122 [Dendrothele bispora CBS 962.96]
MSKENTEESVTEEILEAKDLAAIGLQCAVYDGPLTGQAPTHVYVQGSDGILQYQQAERGDCELFSTFKVQRKRQRDSGVVGSLGDVLEGLQKRDWLSLQGLEEGYEPESGVAALKMPYSEKPHLQLKSLMEVAGCCLLQLEEQIQRAAYEAIKFQEQEETFKDVEYTII